MSASQFIPDREEQAEEILSLLRDRGAEIPEGVGPDDITEFIDPDLPVSLNLRSVAEAIGAAKDLG